MILFCCRCLFNRQIMWVLVRLCCPWTIGSTSPHQHTGTLNLAFTFSNYNIDQLSVIPACIVSNHCLITCCLPYSRTNVHCWQNSTTSGKQSTVHCVVYHQPMCPCFDAECCATRRNYCRLKHSYRGTCSERDKAANVAACQEKHKVLDQKKKQYGCTASLLTVAHQRDYSSQWRACFSVTSVHLRHHTDVQQRYDAYNNFLKFFYEKVKNFHAATDGFQVPSCKAVTTSVTLS